MKCADCKNCKGNIEHSIYAWDYVDNCFYGNPNPYWKAEECPDFVQVHRGVMYDFPKRRGKGQIATCCCH